MNPSRTIAMTIAAPAPEVYAFLAEPRNYPRWAPVVDDHFEELEPLAWRALLPFGERIIRFAPRNAFGVLDHSEQAPDGEPVLNPMRVVPWHESCHLTFSFFRRAAMNDVEFASALEWIEADLLALKSYLEIRR
jgi:hypothetical protein